MSAATWAGRGVLRETEHVPGLLERSVAALACVLAGTTVTLVKDTSPALLLAVVLVPVWAGALWLPLAGRWYAALGVAAGASGVLLTWWHEAGHATNGALVRQSLVALMTLVGTVGVVVWARRSHATRDVALLYSLGILATAVTKPGTENPWKLQYSVGVVVLVLALCLGRRSRLLEVACTLGLALVSVLDDSRSLGAMLLMVAALVTWQMVRTSLRVRSSALGAALQLGLVAVAIFLAMQALLLDGVLGDAARERTQAQIETGGTLLTGGRPEMGATVALVRANPLGVGSGTLVNLRDLNIARDGMAGLNYNTLHNGYVERFMFGFGYEVHSVLGDLWLRFGLAGAALAVTGQLVVLVWVARRLAANKASALSLYLVATTTWDLFFSPFYYVSSATLALVVGLALADDKRSRSWPRPGAQPAAVTE